MEVVIGTYPAQKVLDWMETEMRKRDRERERGRKRGRSKRKHYNITRRCLAPILQRKKEEEEGEAIRGLWVERRDEEKAQLEKCLSSKSAGMGLIPPNHGDACLLPQHWRNRQADLWGFLVSQPSLYGDLWASGRLFQGGQLLRLISSLPHMNTHTCIHVITHKVGAGKE